MSISSRRAIRKPSLHVAAVVHVRVVDQPFPAHRGARFLEIDPHHDVKPLVELAPQAGQPLGVIERGYRIVNRARPDQAQQALILSADDSPNRLARRRHRLGDHFVGGQFILERARGDQRLSRDYV